MEPKNVMQNYMLICHVSVGVLMGISYDICGEIFS